MSKHKNETLVRDGADVLAHVGRADLTDRIDALVKSSFDARLRRLREPLSRRERRIAGRAVRSVRRYLRACQVGQDAVLTGHAPGQPYEHTANLWRESHK